MIVPAASVPTPVALNRLVACTLPNLGTCYLLAVSPIPEHDLTLTETTGTQLLRIYAVSVGVKSVGWAFKAAGKNVLASVSSLSVYATAFLGTTLKDIKATGAVFTPTLTTEDWSILSLNDEAITLIINPPPSLRDSFNE